jgi:phage repressor protein C with HTH and peptisase S24 domain
MQHQQYCLKISGDSMSGIIEPGSIVRVDPAIEATDRGFVILVPLDETDTRRYVRLLHGTEEDEFWVWRSTPPEYQFYRRDQYRCLKITAIHFAYPTTTESAEQAAA